MMGWGLWGEGRVRLQGDSETLRGRRDEPVVKGNVVPVHYAMEAYGGVDV
jgi:hypothetical protein